MRLNRSIEISIQQQQQQKKQKTNNGFVQNQ